MLDEETCQGFEERNQQGLRVTTAFSLFTLLFKTGLFSDTIVPRDKLYIKILRHNYGSRAAEVHPFIREDQNPLYLLVQLNVILLGSPVVAIELLGLVRYLQKLRAVCAIVAFENLGRALERITLATSSQSRRSALIVQIALLLDQVVDLNGDSPAAAISCARGEMFEEMRRHLIQYLTCYLLKLFPGFRGALLNYLQVVEHKKRLGEVFWGTLSELMPFSSSSKTSHPSRVC